MIRFRVLLYMSLLGLLVFGCAGTSNLKGTIEASIFRPAIRQLIQASPEYFEAPYTLIVILDRQASGCKLVETDWWPQWQRHMQEKGFGFVFATSRIDSTEMVVALELENMVAPVLVIPGHEMSVSHIWTPWEGIPLKLLVDSTAAIGYGTLSIVDSVSSREMLDDIDSLTGVGRPETSPDR